MLTLPWGHRSHWAGLLNFYLLRLYPRWMSYAFSMPWPASRERGWPATICCQPASKLLASVIGCLYVLGLPSSSTWCHLMSSSSSSSSSMSCHLCHHCHLVVIIIIIICPLFKQNLYLSLLYDWISFILKLVLFSSLLSVLLKHVILTFFCCWLSYSRHVRFCFD